MEKAERTLHEDLENKYQNYKKWLRERHWDDFIWVLNWDLRKKEFAEYGKGDSLFYTGIYLTALALEKNEAEFIALLKVLNKQKYNKGMYPRYRNTFDTSKDPYYQLVLALVYGSLSFPGNSLVKKTLREIIGAVRENRYYIKDPDGRKTTYGNMIGFIPIFRSIENKAFDLSYLALLSMPVYTLLRRFIQGDHYYNLMMVASHYLIYHPLKKNPADRRVLKWSASVFAFKERKNPYFLMVRDLIGGSQIHRAAVENILRQFPGSRLPNDEEPLAHLDVLWQRDPIHWENHKSQWRYEYSGIDYMILYQFYVRHYH